MNNLENEKEIAKSIRKAAILKNWKLFKQSRLGMVGLYIVAFFFVLTILQPILFITGIWDEGTYHPVVGYVDQTQDFLIVECPK